MAERPAVIGGSVVQHRSRTHRLVGVALVTVLFALAGCAMGSRGGDAGPPGTDEGLAQLANEFIGDRDDFGPLLARLRPDTADYADVFTADILVDAIRHYDGYWQAPSVFPPTERQTEYRLTEATTEELVTGSGDAATFPVGYRDVAAHLRPGLTVHRITFHEPGAAGGIEVDGLIYVNGRWRLFPTPWLVLTVNEPGHHH
jgi:hypothetical protein